MCQVGFRHVERHHHAEVGAQVPAAAVLFEIAAVFAHEDAELHVLAVDGLPRRDHDFGLQGRFGRDGELHGGIDDPRQRIEPVEFDVSLCGGTPGAQQGGQKQEQQSGVFFMRQAYQYENGRNAKIPPADW